MKRIALLLAIFAIGLQSVWAQTKEITGTVTSAEDGSTIPGVSVSVKGTTLGTITNLDGQYTLKAPQDANTLVFSFVGMQTLEATIQGTKVDVEMESDVVGINEVVVTALGIKRSEKAIGYAASSVNAEELTKTRNSDIMSGVSGKVAGVQISSSSSDPGASNSVIIRGVSSLGGSNQPLYVIDGVPMTNNSSGSTSLDESYDFGNAANLVNPDDVENITILKGASATALYGSRASNGVVLITTKDGAGKASVDFNSSIEFSDILRLPEFQNKFGMGWDAHHTMNENGSWGPAFDGSLRLWGTVYNNSQKLKPFLPQENNVKDFFDYGLKYTNSVSLSGGNDQTSYYSSLSYVKQDGLVPTDIDLYNKYTASFRASQQIGNLKVSTSINYSQQENSFAQTGQGLTVINGLYQTPRDISIVSLADYKTDPFDTPDYYYTPYGITNPYFVIDNMEAAYEQKKFFGKMQFDYEIMEGLTAMYRLGIDASDDMQKIGIPEVQAAPGTPNEGSSTNQEGTVTKGATRRHEYTHDMLMNYNNTFDDFSIGTVAGLNINERNVSSVSGSVTGLDIPGFYDLSNSSSTPVLNEFYSKRRLIGLLASVEIGYKELLYLTLNARNDWSSTLPKDNNQFFYYGIASSFVFSELLSDNAKSVIDLGKIRLAYGTTGNDAPVYAINPAFIKSSIYNPFRTLDFPLNGQNAFEVGNTLGNQLLQPEISSEFEIGMQMKFFGNRLGFDIAYYNKTSDNQIFGLALAPSTGYTNQTTNLGEINNKGLEFLLEGTPIQSRDFSWDILLNYSQNENELVSLPEELGDKIPIGGLSTVGFVAIVGEPIGLYEGTVPQRTESGQIIVNPGTGRPLTATEKQIMGSADYDYTMGITNSFSYKDFTLTADLDIRQGGVMFSRTADINYFTGNIVQTTYNDRHTFIIPNSVIEDPDNEGSYVENTTPISKEDFDDYFSDGGSLLDESWLVSRSFVKLRRVALTYNLPNSILNKTPFEGISLTAYGNNLALWTPAENNLIDPEVTTFGNDLEGKFGEFTANPSTRSWGLNLKLNF
jgi:TonB-linked SusC/RagA family outer membrane protein